jgi:hypothetical protein
MSVDILDFGKFEFGIKTWRPFLALINHRSNQFLFDWQRRRATRSQPQIDGMMQEKLGRK